MKLISQHAAEKKIIVIYIVFLTAEFDKLNPAYFENIFNEKKMYKL